MAFEVPPLPYDYNALEPHIDEQTMRIHHDKHHTAYVSKLNATLEGHADLQDKSIEELVRDVASLPDSIRTAVNNVGGGHLNHSIFWKSLSPNGGGEPDGALAGAIDKAFGDFESFKTKFTATAAGVFGSGWAWLCADRSGALIVGGWPNQISPLTEGLKPVLGLDVWEHAYYLKYQNRRPEYIAAFFNVINWNDVSERFGR